MRLRARIAVAALPLAAASAGALYVHTGTPAPPPPVSGPEPARPADPPEQSVRLARNETASALLERAGVGGAEGRALLAALRTRLNLRRVRAGERLVLRRNAAGRLVGGAWETGPAERVEFAADGPASRPRFFAARRELPLVATEARVSVTVRSSLWDAFVEAGEDPALAVLASDALAWQLDFYRDVRPGDRIDLVVERLEHEGRKVRDGALLAVRYTGAEASHELFRYTATDGRVDWYDGHGRSARRALLRQPLPLVRITSRFGGRRHPVLGYWKQHQGVDYGAPTGTPVWSVGDGTVVFAGTKGGNGKLVSVRHVNGYVSHYAHLSRILVRAGQRVQQKERVGLVGATGLATGPHLHYALSRNGAFTNPFSVPASAGPALPAGERAAFRAVVAPLRERLDGAPLVAALARAPGTVDD